MKRYDGTLQKKWRREKGLSICGCMWDSGMDKAKFSSRLLVDERVEALNRPSL